MAIKLGLHQLTALDISPVELIDIAAKTNCQEVSLFSQPLGASQFPLVTRNNYQELRAGLKANGLGVANIECFMLTPNTQTADYKPALELEVPQVSDLPALERVQHIVAGARQQLALAGMA